MHNDKLNEAPFGIRSYERLNIGDLVRWRELSDDGRVKNPLFGLITELYVKVRGNRKVALVKVTQISSYKNNLASLGKEREILAVCVELVSGINAEKERNT